MGPAGPPTFTVDQKLKQYEFYANTAEKVIDRRIGINHFYITIHTGLLTLITVVAGYGLIEVTKSSSTTGTATAASPTPITTFVASAQGAIGVFLCLLGAALSAMWSVNISQYRRLNTAKYDVITKMEEQLPFQAFADEWRIVMGGSRASGPHVRRFREVTRVEQLLPTAALVAYVVIGAAFGIASGFIQSLLTSAGHLI